MGVSSSEYAMSHSRKYAVTKLAHSAHQMCGSAPYALPMPRLSSFYGIVIAMYYREHGTPHFHARYGQHDASIEIGTLEVLGGSLPPRAMTLVREWASLHAEELAANWRRARNRERLERIAPLP